MMELNNLKPAKGSVKGKKMRLGRGEGSGKGGTSARGHKGQKSRSGYSKSFGFEGGQMPLQRRVPKFGFKNFNRIAYKAINLSTIETLVQQLKLSAVSFETLRDAGLVAKNDRVKILGNGEIKSKVDITMHAFSKKAQSAIEAAGGKVETL